MSCVLDASVLVDVLTGALDPASLPDATQGDWHAPAHVDVEVLHALRELVRGGHLSVGRAQDALLDLDDLQVQRWPLHRQFAVRALDLRASLTAYDAAYVVLAEAIDAHSSLGTAGWPRVRRRSLTPRLSWSDCRWGVSCPRRPASARHTPRARPSR